MEPAAEPQGAALAALAAVTLASAKLDFAAARSLLLRFNPDGSVDAAALDEAAAAKIDVAVAEAGVEGVSFAAADILDAIPDGRRDSSIPPPPPAPGA